MHPRTRATLNELKRVRWFSKIGIVDSASVEFVSSWEEAIKSCASPEWGELCMEAANQYRERIMEKSIYQFQRWNEIMMDIKPEVREFVCEKTKEIMDQNNLPQQFLDSVEWDIVHLCMEAEYSDVYKPGFFASQAYWYMQGHFPCGWKGKFPEGSLIVY